ncbi:hypothetical protein [Jeongeupia naejangsanensis]|uniref:Uncharacterized protein n=1 Tax=Jeongeupia naejangsanensis TaxID=613195 RepID=A0ABS2BGX9_9NEIS|nr:hypothetical protein [Jeongeupia naejangsanensis]MBM3114867.1 hypothetical protein [Jeongeupia naejangsanensis]
MSYLQYPRLAFSGLFQSDVSTVNNDPRHFDNATFEDRFQEPTFQPHLKEDSGGAKVTAYNGWWNPWGTGIFGLKNCVVQSALGQDGNEIFSSGEDAAIGLTVGNAGDQPSGKMVDLDPDWQLASCIYGQVITLKAANGQVLMRGEYAPNPFRDLWFNRVGNQRGDSAASAMWQTILTNVTWDLSKIDSPLLQDLKAISEQQNNTLSLRMTTYGYDAALGDSFFSYGIVLGAIGPAYPTEPQSFILGRRFIPAASLLPASSYQAEDYVPNVGWFSAQLVENTLYADLSNALPLIYKQASTPETAYTVDVTCGSGSGSATAPKNGDSNQYWQRPFIIAQLTASTLPTSPYLQPNQYQPLATVDISNANLLSRSGIVSIPVPDSVIASINQLPLALITSASPATGNALLLCCEGNGGWEVRADQFALRLDPNDAEANTLDSNVYVAQYGVPLANAPVALVATSTGPQVDFGDCPTDTPPQTTPRAPAPTINVPADQLAFVQDTTNTNANGMVNLTINGPQALGYPRYYMDGQFFNYTYNFAPDSANGTATVQQQFDQYAIVVHSTYVVPDPVTWADVQPILQQYANLYPVMSQGLFDFSKKEQADANAFILKFVFDKPIDDPDQMPVTRDLSSSKRRALIQYFDSVLQEQGRPASMLDMFGKRCPTRGGGPRTACPEGALSYDQDGKPGCPAK